MKLVLKIFLVFIIFTKISISQNIVITSANNPNEPSIMLNPKNPNIMVAGVNIDGYFYSNDAGQTWTSGSLFSEYGVWGDPVIDVDTAGHFYFYHLSNPSQGSWIDRIVCQKSTDNGVTWSSGTYTGLNGTKVQDKHWTIVDRTNNNIYMTWTQFDVYDSSNPNDSSNIMFSKSLNGGATWSQALRINKVAGNCLDDDNTVEGAVPAVGPNGEIYVAWAGPNGIVFNRSIDQGNTWLTDEILINEMPGGWTYDISGIMRCNGMPVIKCDLSGGVNNGTIYVNWSDQRNGVDNTDIWLTKSTDGGNTWTPAIKVNDDNSNKQQFLTWMDIDQTNGKLYFVFYDRRNYTDDNTDVYMAISDNGGETFLNRKISESPFVPNSSIFFGDYNNIVAHNDTIRPVWTRLNNGDLSILTDVTPIADIILSQPNVSIVDDVNMSVYPNPAKKIAYVSFKLQKLSNIRLEVYNSQGKIVKTIINNEKWHFGKYIIPINIDELNLSSGTYFHKLTINDEAKSTSKIIIE